MKKSKILRELTDTHDKFFRVIEGLSDEAMQEPGVIGNWSVKDIIAHISRWEAEMVKLLWQLQDGQKPDYKELFFGRNIDVINAQWQKEMASRSFSQTMSDFNAVRRQTVRRVEAFSDEDLNDPERFPELKEPLGNWIAGNSFEHEAEHAAQIKLWRSQHKN